MKTSLKTLIVIFWIVMSLVVVHTARADYIYVTGIIVESDISLSTIVIEDENGEVVEIQGFPFHNLEVQLEEVLDPLNPDEDCITIEDGDCVTVIYYTKELGSGEVVNKWESLLTYCEECTVTEPCFDGGLERKPQKNKNRPNPWPWHGQPPGHRR